MFAANETRRYPTLDEMQRADDIFRSLRQLDRVEPGAAYLAFANGEAGDWHAGRSALVMAMGGDAPMFDETWAGRKPGSHVDLPGQRYSDEQQFVDEAILRASECDIEIEQAERAAWGRAPGGDADCR